MKALFTIALLTYCCAVFAQNDPTDTLKALINSKQYDKIVTDYAGTQDYPAKSLYYIGLAYFMKSDDNNCLLFMDRSIAKDANDPQPHFIKAGTLNYMERYSDAIKEFESAIALNAGKAEYYEGLGDAYNGLKQRDLAIASYKKAVEKNEAGSRPYAMIAQIYSEQQQKDKALEVYYQAKGKIAKTSKSYLDALFNIGLFEYQLKAYDKAAAALIELIELAPDDYHARAKLIQVYYATKDYEKAQPYRAQLYAAHQKGLLKENVSEMFCFDQFTWNNRLIQAYERYEKGPKSDIFIKHLFYVVDQEDNVEYTIQTEYSPLAKELGGPQYLLCSTRGDTHATFNIGFNDDFEYDALKKSVIAVLDGKLKPVASSKRE